MFDALLEELRQKGISFELVPVLLYCGEERKCPQGARADGQDEERIRRGIRNSRAVCENVDFPRIDVTDMTAEETAEEIRRLSEPEMKKKPEMRLWGVWVKTEDIKAYCQ